MPKSVNKTFLLGNVGREPELRYTANGTALAKFSLATNEGYKDSSGEWREFTEWHQVVTWGRLAEIIGEYVHTGSKLHVEGRLRTSSWNDKQSGQKRYRTEIVVRELVFLGGARNGSNGRNGNEYTQDEPEPIGSSGDSWQSEGREPDEFRQTVPLSEEDIPF